MNTQQQLAAKARKGPALVIDGAGTGKTSTMIARVKNFSSSLLFTKYLYYVLRGDTAGNIFAQYVQSLKIA